MNANLLIHDMSREKDPIIMTFNSGLFEQVRKPDGLGEQVKMSGKVVFATF